MKKIFFITTTIILLISCNLSNNIVNNLNSSTTTVTNSSSNTTITTIETTITTTTVVNSSYIYVENTSGSQELQAALNEAESTGKSIRLQEGEFILDTDITWTNSNVFSGYINSTTVGEKRTIFRLNKPAKIIFDNITATIDSIDFGSALNPINHSYILDIKNNSDVSIKNINVTMTSFSDALGDFSNNAPIDWFLNSHMGKMFCLITNAKVSATNSRFNGGFKATATNWDAKYGLFITDCTIDDGGIYLNRIDLTAKNTSLIMNLPSNWMVYQWQSATLIYAKNTQNLILGKNDNNEKSYLIIDADKTIPNKTAIINFVNWVIDENVINTTLIEADMYIKANYTIPTSSGYNANSYMIQLADFTDLGNQHNVTIKNSKFDVVSMPIKDSFESQSYIITIHPNMKGSYVVDGNTFLYDFTGNNTNLYIYSLYDNNNTNFSVTQFTNNTFIDPMTTIAEKFIYYYAISSGLGITYGNKADLNNPDRITGGDIFSATGNTIISP